MKQEILDEIKYKTTEWEQKIQNIQRKMKLEDPNLYFLGNTLNYVTDLQEYCSNVY